jgi:beta-glucosidase
MTAYNKVNGTHVSENTEILQGILRNDWGFDGLVMSDWYGTYSVAESIHAGLDIEMPGPTRWRGALAKLSVSSGKIPELVIDDRVRAVLQTVDRVSSLGLSVDEPEQTINSPETAAKQRQIASSSIVLLKNDGNFLPLNKEKTIAVIGPNAKFAAYSGGGSAQLRPYYSVTPFDGIRAYSNSAQYSLGAINYKNLPMLSAFTAAPDGRRGMEMRVYLDPPSMPDRDPVESIYITESSCFLSDYKHPSIDTNLFYVDFEATLVSEADSEFLFSLTVNGTARLYVDGEQVVDNASTQRSGDSFFGSGTAEEVGSKFLAKGRKYTILVQFATAPTSTLRRAGATQMGVGGVQIGGYPKTDPDTLLSAAVNLAKQVDQVILCVGLNSEWESEGWDRQTMDLPSGSDSLVNAICAVNRNVVVVNQSGTPVTMPWADQVRSIIQAWYGGNETGNAIADVLFGQVNPSGKLSLSWPKRVEDNPAYINTRVDDGNVVYGEGIYVGYRWYEKTGRDALFPFGFGLSYTAFQLRDFSVTIDAGFAAASASAKLRVLGNITNTGSREGAEVVQIYVSFPTSSVPRPIKELKGFTKVHLAKDETRQFEVQIELKYACSYWSETCKSWVMEKGTYEVFAGPSSDSVQRAGVFEVGATTRWSGL